MTPANTTVMTRRLGRSGLEVSAIGLGCNAIGGPYWDPSVRTDLPVGYGPVDDHESRRALRRALDLGINFFDTADEYGCGHSETILGQALVGRRLEAVICTKFGYTFDERTQTITGQDVSPSTILTACEGSLRRLGTDYIDIYLYDGQEVCEFMKTSEFYPFRSASARAEYLALYTERARSWPVPSETKLIETQSGQTFLRTSGDPADPPLVLLPGSRDNSLTWIPNITSLSAHYRTYALDSIYDVGLSVRRKKLSKPEHLVIWLDEVLSVLAPDRKVHLAGLSYGGWLASRYALRFPGRVQSLVLLSPAATVLPVALPFLARAMSLLLPGTAPIRTFLYWLLQDTLQSGAAGRAVVDQAVADWVVAKRSFQTLPLIGATVIPDPALQAFQVSTLFLTGENEKVYSAQEAVKRLKRVAPQIKTEIIPRAGHDLWIVQAELVNRKLLDFLGEIEIETSRT